MLRYVFKKIWFNDGEPSRDPAPRDMAAELKKTMDAMRAAFFENGSGRVASERMAQSEIYQDFLKLSHNLKTMNLAGLRRREERIACWINLSNVIVIKRLTRQ